MKKFHLFQLSSDQQKAILGGVADVKADCGGGRSVSCSGTSCRSSDGATGSCLCTGGANGPDMHFCSQEP
ncbi:hypothetical protein [Spirosoma soli]|uniref:hypothetical protein n=1 Tax=Spirosoma soli TaxID=1770529 RepID=UPI0036D3A02F